MLKRKLLKRALPIILSVAMVFETMPATALAAENEESTAVEETALEESEAAGESAESSDDTPESIGAGASDVTEESLASETSVVSTTQETETTASGVSDDNKAETETTTQAETETTTQVETEIAADNAEVNADANAALDTEIIIDEADLVDAVAENPNLKYDADKKAVMAKYDDAETNVFGDLKTSIQDELVTVEVDGKSEGIEGKEEIRENLKYEWQKKNGEEYAGMSGAVPTEPGEYRLLISLGAIDGVCHETSASLDFIITKRQLSVVLQDEEKELDLLSVVPGTKAGAFADNLKNNYILEKESRSWNSDAENISLPEAARGIYFNSFAVTVSEISGASKTPLDAAAELKENCDYVVEIAAEVKDAALYELADIGVLNIKVEDLVETKVKVELKDAAAVISKVYSKDVKISYDTDIKDKITVSIVVPGKKDEETDKETEDTVIEGAVPTLVWCDADKQELGADPDAAPSAAGTYYLDFQYIPAEDNGVYKASKKNYLKVVIEPAPLTLVPLELTGTYYTGMSEADVLKDADYKLVDAAKVDFAIENKETFWGVSYDQPGVTQSYEPVFELIRAEKDANGSAKKDKDGKEIWSHNNGAVLNASKYLYRLMFTGKKAVYEADGTLIDERDVNAADVNTADKNHCFVTMEAALLENSVLVNVQDAKETKIDVSAILAAGMPATEEFYDLYKPNHFLSKVYDGQKLYEERGAYKLAKVTTADGSAIQGAENYDDRLTYTWYRLQEDEGSNPVPVRDEKGKQTGWKEGTTARKMDGNAIPSQAGDYKLVISFSDVDGGYAPSSKTLYYKIDQQMVVVSPTSIPTAYKGATVDSYIERMEEEGTYNIYKVPNNDFSQEYKTEANLMTTWEEDDEGNDDYDLYWYVERLERNDDKTPKKDDDGNDLYKELSRDDTFKVLDENYYRLYAELRCYVNNYANYQVVYNANVEKNNFDREELYYNDHVGITVKEMGTVEIEIEIDESKLTTTKDYNGEPFYNMTLEEARAEIMKAVTIRKAATGEVLSESDPVPTLNMSFIDEYEDGEYEGGQYPVNQIINAGTYRLEIYCPGDETYKESWVDEEDAPEYNIRALKLKVDPYVVDVTAGDKVLDPATGNDGSKNANRDNDILYYSQLTVFDCANMPEKDKPAFEYGSKTYVYGDDKGDEKTIYGFPAYTIVDDDGYPEYHFGATVTKAGETEAYEGYIKYGKDYILQLDGGLAYPYSRNYDVEYVRHPFKAVYRGSSKPGYVQKWNGINGTSLLSQWNAQDGSMTITPMEGVPYVNKEITDVDGDKIKLDGNYFVFKITAPLEFIEDRISREYNDEAEIWEETYDYRPYSADFVYKNSIEKNAKGYVVNENPITGVITIVIPAVKGEETPKKEFEIVWENGYTEKYTIDFTNTVFLDDLTKAVAPKSLAFNGVNTKMIVGEEQQLDVKIKKAQISDIIYLDYRVEQETEVLSITNDDEKGTAGYVTALSVGTATVKAVPVRVVNGVKTDIEGAKAATVKITVSDVTAPSIKKITPIDTEVDIEYVKPSNGYRREVYIIEGSTKLKEDDFKKVLEKTNSEAMKNENWKGIFAVEPEFYSEEPAAVKTNLTKITIDDLKPDTEYTVYVRNVSALRTLHDGTKVVASAKGTVKGFKTTKAQVKDLRVYFKEVKEPEVEGGEAVEKIVYEKQVLLSQKTEQLYTSGQFYQRPVYDPADKNDRGWLELPLDTKTYPELKEYVAPKLTYFLSAEPEAIDVEDVRDFRNYIYVSGRAYKKTNIATIDKKGKISLKGVGTVYVWVYDPATKTYSNDAALDILALPTSVTGKGGKLAVGKGVYLSSLLTYSEGKTKLTGYDTPYLSITDEALKTLNNGEFSVIPTGDGDYYITALKPNATCNITVTDELVALAQGGSATATLQMQSSAIEAVKNMKVTDIVDNGFVLNFAYPVEADNEGYYTNIYMLYRVDITDARGSVVDSFVIGHNNFEYIEELQSFNGNIWDAVSYYDGKKKLFSYRLPIASDKIVRLSSYKVSVTPIYGDDYTAKPTVKAVKTTSFPASYNSLLKNEYDAGNIEIQGIAGSTVLGDRPYLTSGNTYTLKVNDNWDIAKDRATDSLTWKSSNTKVAKIKANAGTYTATLNALQAGTSVIEVTSKVTKKVIARFPVFVKAVGNAKDNYYGDYEYIGEYPYKFDPFYDASIEVLTEANPVRVTAEDLAVDNWIPGGSDQYKWIKFTAPAFGNYTFAVEHGAIAAIITPGSDKEVTQATSYTLFAGQTYYFKVTLDVDNNIDFVMTATSTKVGNNLSVETGFVTIDSDEETTQYIEFRATEDNYYTFYTEDGNNNGINGIYKLGEDQKLENAGAGYNGGKYSVALNTGDIIYLKVVGGNYTLRATKRNAVALTMNKAENLSVTGENGQWYTFTAPVAGTYTFKSENATAMINADYYEGIQASTGKKSPQSEDGKNFSYEVELDAEQKAALWIYPADKAGTTAVTASISVTAEAADTIAVDGEKTLTIPEDGVKWLSAKLDAAGRYTFDFAATEENAAYNIDTKYYVNQINPSKVRSAASTEEFVVSDKYDDADAKVGDTIYVQIRTDKTNEDSETATTPAIASVKATLKKAAVTTLTAGTASDLTVENKGEYWYTFTASSTGKYVFRAVVTQNETGGTHDLIAGKYESVEQKDSNTSLTFERVYALEAGEIVVFKAYPTADRTTVEGTPATTKAQIRVDKLEATPFTLAAPATISLAKGEVKWYSFTALEDNDYTFTKDVTAGAADVEMYSTLGGNSGYRAAVNVATSCSMKQGDVTFFKVTQQGEEAATLTLKAEVPAIDPMTAETVTASVTNAAEKNYVYSAATKGRYEISYTTTPADASVSVQYGFRFDAMDNYVSNGYRELDSVAAGKKIYVQVSTTSETAVSVNLTVKQVAPTAVNAGANAATATPNKATWYSFTATEAGRYAFSKTDAENNSTTATYYKEITNTSPFQSNPSDRFLKVGETVYIKLTANADAQQTTSLKVEKIVLTPIAAETTPVTLKPGETKYYIFTADATADYAFNALKTVTPEGGTPSTVTANISKTVYKNTENETTTVYWGDNVPLDKTETLTFKLTSNNASEDETFSFTYENVDSKVIWIEKVDTPTSITVKKGETQWIGFEAPEDGLFAINTEGVAARANVNLKYETKTLEAADPFKYGVSYTYDTTPGEDGAAVTEPDSITFNVKASRVTPEELTLEKPVSASVARFEQKWVWFKAPENGRYTFNAGNDSLQLKYSRYYYNDGEVGSSYNDGAMPIKDMALTKGQEIALAVFYEDSKNATESFSISVTKLVPDTTSGTIDVSLKDGEYKWYEYTATQTGTYTIEAEGDTTLTDAEIYKKINDENFSDYISGNKTTVSLLENDKLYLKVGSYGPEESNSAKVTITFIEAPGMISALNTETEVQFNKNLDGRWMAFKAPEDGLYNFAIQSNEGLQTYYTLKMSAMGYEVDGAYADGNYVSYTNKLIAKDDTVYIYITNINYSEDAKITMMVTKNAQEVTIQKVNGGVSRFTMDKGADNAVYYVVCAPDEGWYDIRFTAEENAKDEEEELYEAKWYDVHGMSIDPDNYRDSRNINKNGTHYEELHASYANQILSYFYIEKTKGESGKKLIVSVSEAE